MRTAGDVVTTRTWSTPASRHLRTFASASAFPVSTLTASRLPPLLAGTSMVLPSPTGYSSKTV
jgi:hypothetical protein